MDDILTARINALNDLLDRYNSLCRVFMVKNSRLQTKLEKVIEKTCDNIIKTLTSPTIIIADAKIKKIK